MPVENLVPGVASEVADEAAEEVADSEVDLEVAEAEAGTAADMELDTGKKRNPMELVKKATDMEHQEDLEDAGEAEAAEDQVEA